MLVLWPNGTYKIQEQQMLLSLFLPHCRLPLPSHLFFFYELEFVTLFCNPFVGSLGLCEPIGRQKFVSSHLSAYLHVAIDSVSVAFLNYPVKFVHFISISFRFHFWVNDCRTCKAARQSMVSPPFFFVKTFSPIFVIVSQRSRFLRPYPLWDPPHANWLLAPLACYRWYLLTKFLASN